MTVQPSRNLPPFLDAHGRLLLAFVLGVGFYGLFCLPPLVGWIGAVPMRLALAWDVVAISYIVQAVAMMWRHDKARIRARAKAIDIGLPEIVAIVALIGTFSLFAVALVLAQARGLGFEDRLTHIAVGVATVFLSWVALHMIFAVHYAHIYYDPAEHADRDVKGGLEFPGAAEPDYWDFVYFSVVIGMTCQVSDVQVTARHMRHLVTAQGIIAFFYNTVVLALAVNIAAGMG